MHGLGPILRRELAGYFATPVAYVFIVIFLFLAGLFTFAEGLGQFFERGQADLDSFFNFHPWLYLFLVPAISMRLWAEERKAGTIELLMTLPVSLGACVLGKFLAAWCFAGIALVLTFPIWITVNYLGQPDNGAILAGYLGSWLMAGGFLAIGACVSAITRSQVIAFVLSVVVCFLFLIAGFEPVLAFFRSWTPSWFLDLMQGFSFLTNFNSISRGWLEARTVLFFLSLIVVFLFANGIVVQAKKGQ